MRDNAGKSKKKSLLGEAVAGVGATALLLAFFLWLGGIAAVTPWIFHASVGFCALMSSLLLSFSLGPALLEKDLVSDLTRGEAGDFHLVGIPCLLYLSFTVSAYTGWKLHGDTFMVASTDSLIAWAAYGLDNVVRAVLLDFAEVYRLDVSPIEHAAGFWPSTFVFVFRSTLSIGLISVVVRSARIIAKKRAS